VVGIKAERQVVDAGGQWWMPEVEWNPVVVAGAIKHNNLYRHSQNMAWFANVAGVDWWA